MSDTDATADTDGRPRDLSWWRELAARTRWVHGPLFFLGGAIWDYATLRIDRWADNVLLTAYSAMLLLVFALELRHERSAWVPGPVQRHFSWLGFASQFLLGALLSAFGVHVLKAMYPGRAALFILLLLALAVANEAGFHARRGAAARYALLAFIGFQLLSLVVPVFTQVLLPPAAAAAGTMLGIALLLALVVTPVTAHDPPLRGDEAVTRLAHGVAGPVLASLATLAALIGLIRAGVVPALPLVLRDAVIAKGVRRTDSGYDLDEPVHVGTLADLRRGRPAIPWVPGEGVSVFTAVFAPEGIELDLVHDWELYDPEAGWLDKSEIAVDVEGGREQGYRTWTTKEHLTYGLWRVRVRTTHGQELGRVEFDVVAPR